MVSACTILALGVLRLYLANGIRFDVSNEGLRVRTPLRETFHQWSEIVRVDLNRPFHYVVVRGRAGRIAFTSTDDFPTLGDLLFVIHERSQCDLPPHLAAMLGVGSPDRSA